MLRGAGFGEAVQSVPSVRAGVRWSWHGWCGGDRCWNVHSDEASLDRDVVEMDPAVDGESGDPDALLLGGVSWRVSSYSG